MAWVHAAYVAGGGVLANAVPHFVAGVMGRWFPTPFATPPGRGLSSPVVNVLWGCANFAAAYLLLGQVGDFDPRSAADAGLAGLGILLVGLFSARIFGRLPDGAAPDAGRPPAAAA